MELREDVVLPRRLWGELIQWRAGYRCEGCGRSRDELVRDDYTGRLGAHHKDHDKTNNRLGNGACLCPSCHGKEHRKYRSTPKCEPGCTCKRHDQSWNKTDMSKPCRNGHLDWVVYGKQVRCRECAREYGRRYYRENSAYRERQKKSKSNLQRGADLLRR